jgi:hypothetical protein
MDAPYLYIVKFWVHPDSLKTVMSWLDRGHMAEVVAQPGFLFMRRVGLEQVSDDGWSAYMMIYGLESKAVAALFRRAGWKRSHPSVSELITGDDRHIRARHHGGCIDRTDQRMGVRRPDEYGVQRIGLAEVVRKLPHAGHETKILHACD